MGPPRGQTVVLDAFDVDNRPLGRASVVLDPNPAPTPVRRQLAVGSPTGAIRRVEIRWLDPNRSMAGLVVDDVEFEAARPSLTLEPAVLDFGSPAADGSTATRQVTVTNTGNVEVDVSSVGIQGADSGDFTVDAGCTNRSLAPGAACTLELGFATGAIGPRQAEVMLSTNLDPARATLVGTGAQAPTTPPTTPPTASTAPPTGSTPPPTPPPTNSPRPESDRTGWWAIGAAAVLLASAMVARSMVKRTRDRRRRARPRSGTVALLSGTIRSGIGPERAIVAVVVFLDPAQGQFEWTQWRLP
jgi:cell division septation protein DedD